MVVEVSSAAGFAAALSEQMKSMPELKRIGIILCGGNVDIDNQLPWC
jgi:serine racemase